MGLLDQASFDRVVHGGCAACGGASVEIRSFLDRSVALMLADPDDAGRWVHDGEKFVDGTYRRKLRGRRDPAHHDGRAVDGSIVVPARDGYLLVED